MPNRIDSFDDVTILRLFGAQAAEDEKAERLKNYFVKNKSYERLKADIPLRLVVGHKGIGKSALLKIAYLEDVEDDILAIWLQPNDIARAWSVDGSFVDRVEAIKQNVLNIIAEKSLDALDVFGRKVEDNIALSSVRHLFSFVVSKLKEQGGPCLDSEITSRFLQNKIIRIYIDDIDRGWSATEKDIQNISALINAARDLQNEDERLQFRLGIRTDAYNLVRSDNESGDKFDPYKIEVRWTNHDILVVMAKRVADYFEIDVSADELLRMKQNDIARYFEPVLVERFEGAGHWSNAPIHKVLLSLTRERPRDLVKLLWGAAQKAESQSSPKIYTIHLTDSFPEYSKGRISDLISEFRSELPEIERVLYSMKPTAKEVKEKEKKFLYTNDELIAKLNGIAKNQNIFFKNGSKATGQKLAEFLFKIDFVVARRDEENIVRRYYYSDHSKLQSNYTDFGFKWEVHPAYRWALNPIGVTELLKSIEL